MITLTLPSDFEMHVYTYYLNGNNKSKLLTLLTSVYGEQQAIIIASALETADVVQLGTSDVDSSISDIISLHIRHKRKGGTEYMISINNVLHTI